MKEIWDKRFSQETYIYGKKPNEFFKDFIDKLEPGKILLPAEGEGRNAVYAALKGWNVDAFDFSESARHKALNLAFENNVNINYNVLDIQDFQESENSYDLIALIFVHIPQNLRFDFFQKLIKSLSTGGYIIFQVYSIEQLEFATGGPKNIELLYNLEEFNTYFKGFRKIRLEKINKKINEGELHNGLASVIEGVFRKVE